MKQLTLKSLSIFIVCVFVLLMISGMANVSAQTPVGGWQEPENLSNSGSASQPELLQGTDDVIHTIWKDDYVKLVYRKFEGVWSDSSALDLPFANFDFRLLLNRSGGVAAFWIDTTDSNLYYSSVQEGAMARTESWNAPALLAGGVVGFDVLVDDDNQAHLIYARGRETSDNPAGIYYRNSTGSLANWSSSRLVYQSKYYRSFLPAPGITSASTGLTNLNVHIASGRNGETLTTVLSWENPALKKLFFARSLDAGTNWEEPQEVSAPTQDSTLITPRDLITIILGNQTLQVWSLSEPGGNCEMVYRTSSENPAKWTIPQSLESIFGSCPDQLSWKLMENNEIVFVSEKQDSLSLIAWNGTEWSNSQSENQITQFSNPNTFDLITLDQMDTIIINSTLYLVGKDAGSSKDIWFSSNSLDDTEQWYGICEGWNSPQVFSLDNQKINNIRTLNSTGGSFWFIATGPSNSRSKSYIAVQNVLESGPSTFVTVLDNIQGGIFQLNGKAVSQLNRAGLLWSGGTFGELYYAWVDLTQASNPIGWSTPAQLQSKLIGYSPDISTIENQNLYAVFSSPYGTQAGLYWIQSQNGGETWTTPTLIPGTGTQTECPLLSNPTLATTYDGYLHVIFSCRTHEQGLGALGLYSIISSNNGNDWSKPILISDLPVTWATLLIDSANRLHRIYKVEDDKTSLYHSYSSNNGEDWSSPAKFALIEETSGPTTATIDSSGNIHVLQTTYNSDGTGNLQYSRWSGSEWATLQSLDLSTIDQGMISSLSSGIAGNSTLALGLVLNTRASNLQESLIVTSKYALDLTQDVVPGDLDIIPTPTIDALPNEDLISTPTAIVEPTFEPGSLNNTPSASSSSYIGIIAGILVSAVFIFIAIFFIRRNH